MRSTILCVDDEQRVLRSLQAALKQPSYDVRTTSDPNEALELTKSGEVQVVISDQRMPDMGGVTLLREIAKLSPGTVRMLLTGYSDYEATVRSVNEGEVFRFIDKPWDPDRLRTLVSEALQVNASIAANADTVDPSADNAAPRILVLDEDPTTAKTISDCVDSEATVHTAQTLEDAFSVLAEESIDVLVTEAYIGGYGVHGALKRLKRAAPAVQTIVVTSTLDVGSVRRLINESRITRLLPKPVRHGLLKRCIANTVDRARLLRSTPDWTATERPEQVERDEEQPVVRRVMSYLSRIAGH